MKTTSKAKATKAKITKEDNAMNLKRALSYYRLAGKYRIQKDVDRVKKFTALADEARALYESGKASLANSTAVADTITKYRRARAARAAKAA